MIIFIIHNTNNLDNTNESYLNIKIKFTIDKSSYWYILKKYENS